MTNISLLDKLMKFQTYSEAESTIRETLGKEPRPTTESLLRTAYSVGKVQENLKRQFIGDFVKESEDEKVKEADGGEEHSSTSTTGLKKVGDEHEAPESAHAQPDKKDQMGVTVGETFPGQQQPGMMPPMQQQAPPQQQPCGGQQQPPQVPPQAQQQMQYTISEIQKQISQIREAVTAIDKKVQESSRVVPTSLDLPATGIRETTVDNKMGKRQRLQQARQEISRLNATLGKSNIPGTF